MYIDRLSIVAVGRVGDTLGCVDSLLSVCEPLLVLPP